MSVMQLAEAVAPSAPTVRNRRVLLIAYSFPPVGGAGVQRPTKWVKYLPQCGWDVTVLTPENPSVPLRDESLLAEIPAATRIIRARTWEPDYRVKQQLGGSQDTLNSDSLTKRLRRRVMSAAKSAALALLQPDLQVLWVRNAIRAATKELQRVPHDAILVTVPPYSMLSIGAALKKRFGLPVVFDFRDEWDLSSRYLEQASRGWWANWIQSRMQRSLLKQADAVVATTEASAQTYQNKLAAVGNAAQSHCIYNGFDPEDISTEPSARNSESVGADFGFAPLSPGGRGAGGEGDVLGMVGAISSSAAVTSPSSGRSGHLLPPGEKGKQSNTTASNSDDTFRLVYTGTLWNMTDIDPFVRAVEQLHVEQPQLLSRLELVCVGRKTPQQQQILDRLRQTNCRTEFHDYCPHAAVAGWLQRADALCLTLSDVPGAERVVPAKLFEYMAVGKPLLSIVPQGETARLARLLGPDGHFVPRDVVGIAHWLKDRLSQRNSLSGDRVSADIIRPFSRPVLTQRLAEVLNSVTSDWVARPESSEGVVEKSAYHALRKTSGRATRNQDLIEQELRSGGRVGAS